MSEPTEQPAAASDAPSSHPAAGPDPQASSVTPAPTKPRQRIRLKTRGTSTGDSSGKKKKKSKRSGGMTYTNSTDSSLFSGYRLWLMALLIMLGGGVMMYLVISRLGAPPANLSD